MSTALDSVPSMIDRIRHDLVGLKIPRALEALDHVVRRLEQGELSALEAIDILLSEELTLRENSRIKTALRMGRLATIKTLTGFDFTFQPSLDRDRIFTLAQLGFVDRHEAIHFLGPPGTGKSHLAVALGVEAVKAGKSVYFCTLADLIAALSRAEREGRLQDEIGYLPVIAGGGNLFFQLVNALYERGAMILTSNRGFAEWGDVFGDAVVATALLDVCKLVAYSRKNRNIKSHLLVSIDPGNPRGHQLDAREPFVVKRASGARQGGIGKSKQKPTL
ncbi:ATP-binding protein [Rhizobium favelukesii]|uniref:IstB domain-containing protein ATP-binding protein n=1 Tax=Rhizobium favelukesii TaxID=348824 RepID=W6RJP3_9HYPH|nr:IstB domain-containing protein ATP-binding protein [Rhizobium favelukesii]